MLSRLPQIFSSLFVSLALAACSSPVSEEELMARATSAFANGNLAAAEVDVKTALQQNPENAAARSLYGEIYLQQMNPSAAIIEFERSINAAATNETRLLLAKALVQAGETAEVLSDFEAGVYRALSEQPEFNAVLARAYVAQAQYDEARAALAAALTYANSSDDGSDYVDVTRAVFAVQLDKDAETAKTLLQAVVERSPNDANAWSLLGILATQDEDREAAEQYFANASQANPYRLGDRLQLVNTQISLGKEDAASKDLAQLEKLMPNYPEVNFLRGQLYFDSGDYKNALDAFSQVLTANPNHAGALLLSANANVREQNLTTAQRQLTQFLQKQPGHLQAGLLLGNIWREQGEPAKVEAVAREILKEHEMDVRALSLLAMALAAQGMNVESAQAYEQIASLQPESTEALVALGSQQLVAGDIEAGLEQLKAAVALDPSNTTARERLIEAQLAVKDVSAAEDAARAYLEQAPDSLRSSVYLGRVLLQSENLGGARKAFEQVLAKDPGNIGANGGMAALAMRDEDLDGAAAAFEAALEASPGELSTSMNLALLQEKMGELEAMQKTLKSAVDANPEALEPRLALARYALSQNRADDVISLMMPVEENAAGDYRVQQVLAGANLAVGEPGAAADNARRLLELRSEDPSALAMVARVEAANSRPEQAQVHLEKALGALPENTEIRKMLIEVLIQQNKREQASTEIAKLPLAVQNETRVLIVRGRLAMAASEPAAAKALFAQAFEQTRNSVTLSLLTGSQWALGERSEAITVLEDWLEEYPDDLLILNALATRQVESGNNEEARRLYDKVIEQQPENALALNNLAWIYREIDTQIALDYIVRADKLAPQSPQIKDTYAMIELERGEFDRALSLNSKALEAAPRSPDIQLNRAQILVGAKRTEEARALLKELVAGPAFASQAAARALLQEL